MCLDEDSDYHDKLVCCHTEDYEVTTPPKSASERKERAKAQRIKKPKPTIPNDGWGW